MKVLAFLFLLSSTSTAVSAYFNSLNLVRSPTTFLRAKNAEDPAALLDAKLKDTNLYFVGMMGTGKSAVGKAVCEQLGTYKFLDLDDVIEKNEGRSIPDIFSSDGEDTFRDVETKALDSVNSETKALISTGGGIVVRPINMGKMSRGISIWLDVDPEVIIKRVMSDKKNVRPLLQTEDPLQTIKDLLEKRKGPYSQAAIRVEITGDMGIDVCADKVIEKLNDYVDENPCE